MGLGLVAGAGAGAGSRFECRGKGYGFVGSEAEVCEASPRIAGGYCLKPGAIHRAEIV